MADNIIGNEHDKCSGDTQSTTKAIGGVTFRIGERSFEGYIFHRPIKDMNCVIRDVYDIEISEKCFLALKKITDRDYWVSMTADKYHFREDERG